MNSLRSRRHKRASWTGALACALASVVACGEAIANPPKRIVSLNVCVDQILIDLVQKHRIAAVSHLAADPTVSAVAERAAGIAATRGEAEAVLAFDPDLVLAGEYSTPATVSILERVGRRVVKVASANDLPGIRLAVRQIASAVGEKDRGEAMLERLDRELKRHETTSQNRPTALVYQVNGLTVGAGSLGAAVLEQAGFANHAGALKLGKGDQVSLEILAANPPDLIVLTGPKNEYRTVVAENLSHPALTQVLKSTRSLTVPWRTWLCGTPFIADAVARLAAERQRIEKGPRVQ